MKVVIISQRVDEIKNYGEVRDALDEQWHRLFQKVGAILIPMPNVMEGGAEILKRVRPDAIVLSGGNTPAKYGGTAPQRDQVDELLIQYAVKNSVQLLGVCRGMQSIVLHFGGSLKKVEGHVAVKHKIVGEIQRVVNSYHTYAVDRQGQELHVMAWTEQGDIEAVRHVRYPIYGIMWHPERGAAFDEEDISFMKKMLLI